MKLHRLAVACFLLAVACVFAGRPCFGQGPAKTDIVVPAVDFSAQGGGEVRKTPAPRTLAPVAGGWVHFWYTPGHWIEWTFDAPTAGDYQVGLRYATKYAARRGLSVNGQEVKGLASFALEPTGRWTDWKEADLTAPVALKAGRNFLRLTCLDDCSVRLAQVRLTAPGQKPVTVAAGDLSGQGGGEAQVARTPEQGYLRGWSKKDHWLEWKIEVPADGQYAVYAHYATEDRCPRELQVNGQPVKGLERFSLPSTGDEAVWSEAILPAPVALRKGTNVLRLTSLGGEAEVGLAGLRVVPATAGTFASVPATQPAEEAPAKQIPYKAVAFDAASLGPALPAGDPAQLLKVGQQVSLGALKATVKTLDALPYVANAYSSRFVYERFDEPGLARIRSQYKLDEVVAAGKDEFEKQLMLMQWVYDRWDFGHARERYNLRDPFEILDFAKREHKFQCMHSAAVLQAAMNSMGWVCRQMCIPQHTFNEVWSNQHRKWVMFDATSNYAPERAGVPLNTYELRQGLLYEDGNGVVSLRRVGDQLQRTPKDAKYGQRLIFVGYIPNTNNLVSGPDYSRMFITKDKLAEGKSWHTRECPKDPANEPYFPINQAALALSADGTGVKVTIGTMTPNFREFQVRVDGGEWKTSPASFTWPIRKGLNRLQARSVNLFGVAGPVSIVEIETKE